MSKFVVPVKWFRCWSVNEHGYGRCRLRWGHWLKPGEWTFLHRGERSPNVWL